MAPHIAGDCRISTKEDAKNWYLVLLVLLLLGISLIRIYNLATNAIDLSGDEAHYWEWSRRLDLCYYSKPPGVAHLIRLGTSVLGDTVLGVRICAIIFSFLSSLLLFKIGTQLYDKDVGFVCAILFQVVPIFAAYGVGMTPDSPLIFFWILSLLLFHKALATSSPSTWLLLSVSLGLGLLSKYAIIFFYPPAFVLLGLFKENRKHLHTPWPYIAFLSSLLFFLPVIIWNMKHNWVMFRHDIGHTKLTQGFTISFDSFANFVGSQVGVITPILLVLIVYAVIKQRKQDPFCFWFCIPILIGFLLKSLQGKVQANWSLMAYITGLISFSAFLVHNYTKFGRFMKTIIIVGLIIPLVGTIFLHCPQLVHQLDFPPDKNPLKKLLGWKELGREITKLSVEIEKPYFIFSDHYMTASELAFYVEGHPTTYCANLGRRMNQYDIWPGFNDLIHYNAIYVTKRKMSPKLAQAFERYEKKPVVLYDERGRVITEFAAFLCYDFQGMDAEKPASF
jgi:hypothetical protein